MRLQGKRAVVTGAAGHGIGRAIVEAFLAEGAVCTVLDIREPVDPYRSGPEGVAGPMALTADVSDPAALTGALEQAHREMDGIDILVNAAARLERKPFLELTLDDWDDVHAVDLRPYFVATQWVARALVERSRPGAIVNVASITAHIGVAGQSHYSAAKGGVLSLTRSAAVELAEHGIRVNSVSPGTVETDFNRALLADPEFRALRAQAIPIGRIGFPPDIAAAVVLLASDDGGFMTGTDILIDGGQMAW